MEQEISKLISNDCRLIFIIAGICILVALIVLAVQYDNNIQQGPSMQISTLFIDLYFWVFHILDKNGNNANIGIRGFTT